MSNFIKNLFKSKKGILLFVVFFPIFLLILFFMFMVKTTKAIWKSNMKTPYRYIAIIALWSIIFIPGLANNVSDTKQGASKTSQPQWECIGPDGKKIGLDRQSCEDFNNAWKNKPQVAKQETTITPSIQPSTEPTVVQTNYAPVNAKPAPSNTPVPEQANQSAPATGETVSQRNAVRKAQSYLSYSGFSHDGLVAQLEYEKFSHEDAVYGADNSGGNWNEEAAQKAKSYMEYSAFSRDGLIEQLKYEKFTQEQAEYGANSVGI